MPGVGAVTHPFPHPWHPGAASLCPPFPAHSGHSSSGTECPSIPGCRSRSPKLSGNLRNPSVKSAGFVGQRAQTLHMFPTHITSQLGNAHSSQPLILPFLPVGFVREMSLPAPDLRKGSALCVPDGLSSWLGFDQGKEAAGGWILPQNVPVEAFGTVCPGGLLVVTLLPPSCCRFLPWGTHQGPAAPQKFCKGSA